MADLVWLDGTLVAADRATVSAFDHGLTVGDGVFETLRAIEGTPFAARRHLARLRRSASLTGLGIPWTDAHLREAMAAVAGNAPVERLRITVTSGAAPLGPARGDGPPTVVVAAAPMGPAAPSIAAGRLSWPRNERSPLAQVKSTSHAESVLALAEARANGWQEAILANSQGHLCEGSGSNVFVVVEGRLRTPPLSAGCLPGITRQLLLEIVEAVEEELPLDVLDRAEELFVTSTGRGVQPVHEVDGRPLPAPGPVTDAAARAFAALVASDLDP